MVPAGSSPGDRRPAPVVAWLLPALLMAAVAAVAVSVVSSTARAPVAWCGAAGTVTVALVAAEAARRGRTLAAQRARAAQQEAELRHQLAQQEAATARLANELLPGAVARLQQGEFVSDVINGTVPPETGLAPEFRTAHQAVVRSVLEAVSAEEDLRESAQRAFVNIARRVQAIVHQQANDLREMEDRHGNDPRVFGDLLRLDHGNALVGRLADSIAVLGGARPGRQWSKPVPLFSVLRGAMSRILDYQRVDLHSVTEVAIVGPAVEPLIHALAELLDNATRYSPPQTRVHLTAVEVQAGIAVEIEDGGVSLSEEGRARAERMLQEAEAGIDLNDLGETPRLGLAVVGRLAQAWGFQVSLRSSAYGGVRAVLVVPQDLITTAPATGRAHGIGAVSGPRPDRADRAPRQAPAPRPVSSPQQRTTLRQEQDDEVPVVSERTPNGLPQRRRRASVPAARTGSAEPDGTPAASPVKPTSEPEPGLWLAAFQSGINGQAVKADVAQQTGDVTSDKDDQL